MKKVNRFTEIKNIVTTVSRSELETLLSLFETHKNTEISKKGAAMVTAISNQPDIEEFQLLEKIGFDKHKEGTLSAFLMFVRNVILESLILDINLERPGEYSNHFRNKVSGTKKLLQVQILLGKGLYQEAMKLNEEVKSKVEKYQELDLLYESTYIQSICNSGEGSTRAFKKTLVETNIANMRRNQLKKAQLVFLNAHFKFKKLNKNSESDILKTISELIELNQKDPQVKIRYFILSLKAKYEMYKGNFTLAEETHKEQLELVRNSPILQSTERESHILLKQSIALLHLRKIDETRKVLEWTNHLVKKSSFDHFVVLKRLIYLDFYSKNYLDLEETIENNIKSKYTRRLPFAIFRIQFFKAALSLFTEQPRTCAKILLEEIKLKQPCSDDLKLGQVVFLYMSAIELAQSEKHLKEEALQLCNSTFEALGSENLRKRDMTIVKIFKRLLSHPEELNHPSETLTKLLGKLNLKNAEMRWEPFTYEIIPINTWFKAKSDAAFSKLIIPNGGLLEDTLPA